MIMRVRNSYSNNFNHGHIKIEYMKFFLFYFICKLYYFDILVQFLVTKKIERSIDIPDILIHYIFPLLIGNPILT